MTEGECVQLQVIADSEITQAPPPLLVSLEAEPPLGGSLEVHSELHNVACSGWFSPLTFALQIRLEINS